MSIKKRSILSSISLNLWIFIFNISNLLGFNIILYSEKLIEKRIYDKHRDDFTYPMRKEFSKIILSILITMLFTIIIKLFNLINYEDYRVNALQMADDRQNFGERFARKKFYYRLIVGMIMLIVILFMWLYSIGFCYIYYHTQKNWIYSGIWSLFLDWIIFAPLFLFLISLYKYKKGNEVIEYYIKRLFCF